MKTTGLLFLALLLLARPAAAQVVISEFLASNKATLADENGDFSDWVELHNTNDFAVDLTGWALTDNANNLTKWRFPATNIAAQGYLVVFASNKNRAVPGQPLHTSFALSAGGEYLGLVFSNGTTIVSQYAPVFPEQYEDISYGVSAETPHYFTTPTPGVDNGTNFFARVADPQFSHPRGFYSNAFSLTLTCATTNATIRFTTNGSAPSLTNGITYTNALAITGTLPVRAGAFRSGFEPSAVGTQTYLFLDDIILQSRNSALAVGWPTNWGSNRVDYGMDLRVVTNPLYVGTIRSDLQAIPTLSLVMRREDLFHTNTGIYANASQSGRAWERPASVEWIYPEGTPGFQINAGVRIRGGSSTSTANAKHSFRLFFRSEYGDPRLVFPLFGPNGVDTFTGGIDLPTCQNYSWNNLNNLNVLAVYVRDQFCRDTQMAMGHAGERGVFCHLYINGFYWGLYCPSERPEASYAASHFGGGEEDYDVMKSTGTPLLSTEATDGDDAAWNRLWQIATNGFASEAHYQRIQGRNPDGTRNPAYDLLLDVDNLIDYQLVAVYAGSLDGPVTEDGLRPNNWFGIRRRDGTMGFRFFVHDFELTLLDTNANRLGPFPAGNPALGSGLTNASPQYLWQQLQENPGFRLRVADRVQKHFFNGGVLTPAACLARFQARTHEIDRAIVGESARWGDANQSPGYTRDADWAPRVAKMETNYFPFRSAVVLDQLRARNLFPAVPAPIFSHPGGNVTNGFVLTLSAPGGLIYYTLNQTDPRQADGSPAPAARLCTQPLPLWTSATVQARVLSNGVWSAAATATFRLPSVTNWEEWQTLFFSPEELVDTGLSGMTADADGDDADNQSEFLAGTHPRDASSRFVLHARWSKDMAVPVLNFDVPAGKDCTLQSAPAPLPNHWQTLTNLPAGEFMQAMEITDITGGNAARFYRLVMP